MFLNSQNELEPHVVAVGDTRSPIGFKLRNRRGQPIDLASLTLKVYGKKDDGTAWIALSAATAHPTRTFTAATTDWITDEDNKAENGDQIVLSNSGGALPAGLAASTRYFVRDWEPNRFKVSLTPGGDIVDITGTGTGTHSYYIVGSGQYQFQDADVASGFAGTNWLWVTVTDGSSDIDTFPLVRKANSRALRVEIVGPA